MHKERQYFNDIEDESKFVFSQYNTGKHRKVI